MAQTGICSFGEDPRNILMWSHYSQNHTGICFQFETAKDYLTFAYALKVEYSIEYPVVNWIRDFDDGIEKVLLRKHEGWSYEQERRIVQPNNAHKHLSYDHNAITGIIFGCKTPSDSVKMIKKILEERRKANMSDVPIFFARQHPSQYKLSIFRKPASG